MYPICGFVLLSATLYLSSAQPCCPPFITRARAIFNGSQNNVTGTVDFYQDVYGYPVRVKGEIEGLPPGLHGFAVHRFANFSDGCISVGGHFNPFQRAHGGREASSRHAGDLGNLRADGFGRARIGLRDYQLSLNGQYAILGRSLVIAEKEDDQGTGQSEESLTNGNVGAPLACAVISIVSEKYPNLSNRV